MAFYRQIASVVYSIIWNVIKKKKKKMLRYEYKI